MTESVLPSEDLERLLAYLRTSRGFDFTSYKRTTLGRRIEKRMQIVGVEGYAAYEEFLEVHENEFQVLFNMILINVTSFFRDPEAWEFLEKTAIPAILDRKGPDANVRVWVAACASGEEAFTIAMLLAEAMGKEAFRERVKLYATDLDEEALSTGRAATYSEKSLESVPPHLREKYFERVHGHFVFDRDLRRTIIFGRLDLIGDAPISRVDLLTCRNALMYFNAETQERVLRRFHFALTENGYMMLGRAETMLNSSELFAAVDLKNRVFSKLPRGGRNRGFAFAMDGAETLRPEPDGIAVREAALDAMEDAQVVLDSANRIALVNERARLIFGLSKRDIGAAFHDLEVSFRPVELRSGIEQAHAQRRVVRHKDVAWATATGEALALDVAISALRDGNGEFLGTSVVFEDTTALRRLNGELNTFRQELETAYEEVQSTNEELQTTNEELQSSNEEMETTNEELQSANEELETMNEELQSANEEMETVNEELRGRSIDLNEANAFLESVLAGLKDGVIVVDGDLKILAWNFRSEDMWGLRSDEVLGKHLLNLDIGLPVDEFRNPVRACLTLNEVQTAKVEATNRRGRRSECDVTFTPLRNGSREGRGVIIFCVCDAKE